MKSSESIAKLATALAVVQACIKPVAKDATNPHFKNKYASLDAIMESVRDLLAVNGLAVVQGGGAPISNVDGLVTGVAVETMLVHASGEYIASTITLPLDKATPQAVGSAVSYGRRYGVSALLALTTDEDDDGNAASRTTQTRRAAQNSTQSTTQTSTAQQNGNGTHATPHARPMPFGKSRGKPLGEMETDDLFSAAKWCTEKGKYADLVTDINAVLADRAEAEASA